MTTADPIRQRQAMIRRMERRIACEGKVIFPAIPAMVDDYTSRCEQLFAALGRRFNDAERDQLHKILLEQLREAFSRSQRSQITVSYQAQVSGALNYVVAPQHASLQQTYEGWVHTRQPPFFGIAPDAKVLTTAQELGEPAQCRVLDIGAGTGRNALALARQGHPVDAIELTPKFAEILSQTAQTESLDVRVMCKDVFQARDALHGPYRLMVLSEVVPDFRSATQLRELFELASECLATDGVLLINTFVSQPHYCADDAVREFAQQVYSYFFTTEEINAAAHNLSLEKISDESVYDYEKNHLPSGIWPPTNWYPQWVMGLDIFELAAENSPISMRWLAYRKLPQPSSTSQDFNESDLATKI